MGLHTFLDTTLARNKLTLYGYLFTKTENIADD